MRFNKRNFPTDNGQFTDNMSEKNTESGGNQPSNLSEDEFLTDKGYGHKNRFHQPPNQDQEPKPSAIPKQSSSKPIFAAFYRPHVWFNEEVNAEIKKMLEADVIEECESAWAAPIVLSRRRMVLSDFALTTGNRMTKQFPIVILC